MLACLLAFAGGLLAQAPEEARITFQGREFPYLYSALPAGSVPLVMVLASDAREAWQQWQPAVASRKWRLAVAPGIAGWSNGGAKILEAVLGDVTRRAGSDPLRVYLSGDAAGVFYAVAREPHLWAAALALSGNPKPAIDTNRLFAANAQLVPLLWATSAADDDPAVRRLTVAGFRFERRDPAKLTVDQALDFLAANRREPYPSKIDCETGSGAFPRCYWLEITKFDPARRNDVLRSSRVIPGSGASLALGGFGFDVSAAGPGVAVGWLPPNYTGPLKLGDRVLALRGKPIADAHDYVQRMDGAMEEGPATVTVGRGKERLRLETRVVLPKREETITARVQTEFSIESHDLFIVSRNIAELRLEAPDAWLPIQVNWNGREFGKLEAAGCYLLGDTGARKCAP